MVKYFKSFLLYIFVLLLSKVRICLSYNPSMATHMHKTVLRLYSVGYLQLITPLRVAWGQD